MVFYSILDSPYSSDILENPSQSGFSGKSNKFPTMGYPLGPGGYGRRAERAHFFHTIARETAAVTIAKAEPACFSDVDKNMVDSREQRGMPATQRMEVWFRGSP